MSTLGKRLIQSAKESRGITAADIICDFPVERQTRISHLNQQLLIDQIGELVEGVDVDLDAPIEGDVAI